MSMTTESTPVAPRRPPRLALTRLAYALRRALEPRGIGRQLGWGALAALPGFALAGPAGEQLAQGAATVTRPDGATTRIDQSSQNAVLNWQSFSVGGQEYVQFVQPGTNAAVLNRVVGGGTSEILGRIEANGRVFLVNPQGVYFGPGAQVDASGFAASALDIDDADFMAGRYQFAKGAGTGGAVTNEGSVSADQFVVLMGDRVDNRGIVQARLGTVVLAAGSATTLELDDAGLVNFAVDEKTAAAMAGVENTGQIIADGGRVLMTAKVADDLVATAVNNAGLVRARSIESHDGEIFLRAEGGDIRQAGVLDADGSAGQDGGRIFVKGDRDVVLEDGARVSAQGDGAGHGGTVRLIANDTLHVRENALVSVEGGAESVKGGGTLELSGHRTMNIRGQTKVGEGGALVIDPGRLQILNNNSAPAGSGTTGGTSGSSSSGYGSGSGTGTDNVTVGKGYIEDLLNSSIDVVLVASDEIFAASNFAINATGSADLSLRIGFVSSGSGGSLSGADAFSECGDLGVCLEVGGSGIFSRDAHGSINLGGVNFNIGGDFEASAGSQTGGITLGNVNAQDIRLLAGTSEEADLQTVGNIATGNLTAVSSPDIRITGNTVVVNTLTLLSTSSESDAELDIRANRLIVNGNIDMFGGDDAFLDIEALDSIVVNGNVALVASDSAEAQFRAGEGVTFNGNVGLFAQDRADLDVISRFGTIIFNGAVNASAALDSGQAFVGALAGDGVIARQLVQASAHFSTIAFGVTGRGAPPGGNFIRTEGAGLLLANSVFLGRGSEDSSPGIDVLPTAIDVRTHADNVLVGNLGSAAFGYGSSGYGSSDGFSFEPSNVSDPGTMDIFVDNSSSPDPLAFVFLNEGFNAGSVRVRAVSDTLFFGDFAARNLAVGVSQGAVGFTGKVKVGDLPLPPAFGDPVLVNGLLRTQEIFNRGPGVPSFNGQQGVGPNAVFVARDGIFFDQGMHFSDPDVPYVVFQTDGELDFGPGLTADPHLDFLAQFAKFTPDSNIIIENSPDLGFAHFYNTEHFQKLPGTSLVFGGEGLGFGGAQRGNISIGALGPLDVGDQNVAFVTRGNARLSPNFTSRGFVGVLRLLGGVPIFLDASAVAIQEELQEVFELPIVNEFELEEEEEQDKDQELVDVEGEGEGEGEQLVTAESNTGQMCE